MSRLIVRVSWSGSTASSWGGSRDQGCRLAADCDRRLLLLCLGRARHLPPGQPDGEQTSKLAQRVAPSSKQRAGDSSASSPTTATSSAPRTSARPSSSSARVTPIRAGRPQTNGHVEALHRPILQECWRPAFARYLYPRYTGLRRELNHYIAYYNHDRAHHGRLTHGRIPADIVYGARKMETR